MSLRMGPGYAALVDRATAAHAANRNPSGITATDIARARLYCYGFRPQTIGAFHASNVALDEHSPGSGEAAVLRTRATEALRDLADLAMDPVPTDFRAVLSTFQHYHLGIQRVLDSLEREADLDKNPHVSRVAALFRTTMESVSGAGGLAVNQDTHAPEQASFVVPGLGIVIVPLVYGDYHSWNLAWLAGEERNVPTHQHERGVEIHLGYEPTRGQTVLGQSRCDCEEGYAMPIPPLTPHGWVNTSSEPHHVPFIFGSLDMGGWGVFLDVEPRPEPVSSLELTDRDSPAFADMVYLERELDRMAALDGTERSILISHTATARDGTGGLELAVSHVGREGLQLHGDRFRIVSISRGSGRVRIANFEQAVESHDHFGIPSEMHAQLIPSGDDPLVILDATIRDA